MFLPTKLSAKWGVGCCGAGVVAACGFGVFAASSRSFGGGACAIWRNIAM